MRTLRVFRLTKEAEKRGINWNNFCEEDIEVVEDIQIEDPEGKVEVEDLLYEHGYFDFDIYGAKWI